MIDQARRALALLRAPEVSRPAICGFALWGILIQYRILPHGVIFVHILLLFLVAFLAGLLILRRFGAEWLEGSAPWVAALGYVAVGTGANCNLLFFYLMSDIYYPYPHPDHPQLRVFLFYSAMLALAAIFMAFGGRAMRRMAESSAPLRDLATGLLSFGVGLLAGNVVAGSNWIAGLFVSLVLLALVLPTSRRGVAAGLAAVAIAFGIHSRQDDLVFLGSLQEANLVGKADSPYTRSHFYTFADDRCAAIASGFHVITYNCRDVDMLPRGLRYFFRALVQGLPSYRALIVGRTLAMYPNLMLAANPDAEFIKAVEFDHTLENMVETRLNPLTVEPQNLGKLQYAVGDIARYVLEQDGPYNFVIFNGPGLSQYAIPFLLPHHEQFFFASRVMDHIFNNLLGPDGVLVVDWGGRATEERDFIVNSLPAGVYSAAFWYVMIDPPFTANPLTYVVASRNPENIADLRKYSNTSSFFKDITDVPQEQTWDQWITWDHPVARPNIVYVQLSVLVALFVVLFAAMLYLRLWPTCLLPGRVTLQPWLAGVAGIAWFIDVTCRQSHQPIGYGYVWPVLALVFFAAMAAALGREYPPTRRFQTLLGACAVALTLALAAADLTGPLVAAPVVLEGLLAGWIWRSVLKGDIGVNLSAIFGGVATGFFVVQGVFITLGFNGSAALAGLCTLAVPVLSRMRADDLVRV